MVETIPDTLLGKGGVGYGTFVFVSPEGGVIIDAFRDSVREKLPPDLLWYTPTDSLHMTLFEIAMLYKYDYQLDKDSWFSDHRAHIVETLGNILSGVSPIAVQFNEVEVSPKAIIIKATDDGAFERIRAEAQKAGLIMPESRTPPDIIHSSICRYQSVVDLGLVQKGVDAETLDFTMNVNQFNLERMSIVPIGGRETVATYQLQKNT